MDSHCKQIKSLPAHPKIQALPDFDANANAVAIESIKLENEGWERDSQITEPTERRF